MYLFRIAFLCLTIFLMGCNDAREIPRKYYKLDEGVVSELLDTMARVTRSKEVGKLKGFYSRRVVLEVTDERGNLFSPEYQALARQIELQAEYGTDYDIETLEQLVFISDDQVSAVVQQRVREYWTFEERFNDVSVEYIMRMDWQLINGVPQIIRVTKRIVDRTILNGDRRIQNYGPETAPRSM